MKKLLLVFLAVALAACGGGGGGGDGEAGQTGSFKISFNTSRLDLSQIEGGTPASQVIYATASGSTDKDVLLAADVTGTGIATPINVAIDTVTRTASITVVAAANLPAGTYSGTITLKACADQACKVHHAGSPHLLAYTLTVRPGLGVSATSVSLAAVETGTSGISSVGFNPALASSGVTASVAYQGAPLYWLNVNIEGSAVKLQASAADLMDGTYRATLTISSLATSQVAQVPVTFNVGAGISVPEGTDLVIDSRTGTAQLGGTIDVAVAPGANVTRWNVASNAPWLTLVQASGDFGTDPAWVIDQSLFNGLPNNEKHHAVVTVTTDGNLRSRTYTVRAHKQLAEIKGLDALALFAGEAGNVMVYGSNLDSLPNDSSAITVGGVAPLGITHLDDSVVRLSMPAMAAGTHAVSAHAASGMTTQDRTLHVITRASYGYQAFDTQGLKRVVVWDAASQSAFVVNDALVSIMRYAVVGGQFELTDTHSFRALDAIAMSPDHSTLYALSAGKMLYKLSPTDLSTVSMVDLDPMGTAGDGEALSVPLAVMGDNRLMHPLYGWVDLDTGARTEFNFADGGYNTYGLASWGAVSGDGYRMIRPDSGRFSPSSPMYHTEVGSDLFTAYSSNGAAPFFYRYAVSHDGGVWAFNNQVLDYNLNIRGNIALPDGWVGNEAVLSRNGSRLYYYAQSVAGQQARVYVFDTSEVLTTTINYPVLGHIDLAVLPNCPYDSTGNTPNCYTFNTRMAIADDDLTLFIAGDRKFLVVPVPESLRSAVSVQGSALSGQTRMPGLR